MGCSDEFGSDREEPTIRLTSCRSDGRCPECGADPVPAYAKQPMACGCLSSGAHCWETACAARHLSALLTEALRRLSERTNADIQRGMSYVLSIRCMKHRNVPQMNATEARGGECAACAVESTNQVLATIRTHEMAAEERANRMEEERDAAIEAQKRHLNEATEAVHDLGAKLDAALQKAEFWKTSDEAWVDVAGRAMALLGHPNSSDLIGVAEKIVERMAEVEAQRDDAIRERIRERDEAQAKLVEEREAMASISGELVQAQVKVAKERDFYRAALEECGELRSEARERADRAEALLQECDAYLRNYMTKLGFGEQGAALLAKIKEVLG